jgi:hypothetical protein
MSEDEFLLSEVRDRKGSPFRVIFVTENEVYCFRDRSGFIRSTVNIEDGNGSGEFQELETATPSIVVVDQFSGSTTVN